MVSRVARGLRLACCLPYSVGRAFTPAGAVRLCFYVLGKEAKPGPALQDLVASLAGCLPLSAAIRFLPRFMAPVPGPPLRNQRFALVLPAAKTEKAAASSEARGTAQGKSRGPSAPPRFTIRQHLLRRSGLQYIQYCCALAPCICYRLASGSALQDHRLYPRSCGPLWKPRRSDGVARDGLRSSQGKGSLLQYRFFPAGTAHPGSRSETPPAFAGGPICGKRLPCPFACRPRSVRRAPPCKTNIPPLTPAFPGRKTAGGRFFAGRAAGFKKNSRFL